MQEESQFEITKALATLMVSSVFASIGGDIGSGIFLSSGSGVIQATLPGLLAGLIGGAFLVNFLMKEKGKHSNIS